MEIRRGRPSDVETIWAMLRDSAIEQDALSKLVVTPENLLADGFRDDPRFQTLIAEKEGKAAGLALYFFNYSTWGSRKGLYLEDLYVRPAYRRRGVALRLLQTLASLAETEGCGRFQWIVHRENRSAIRFYESFGAKPLEGWLLMSLKL